MPNETPATQDAKGEKIEPLEIPPDGSYWFTFGDDDEQIVSTVVDGTLYVAEDVPGEYFIRTIRNTYPRARFIAPILFPSAQSSRDADIVRVLRESIDALGKANSCASLPDEVGDHCREVRKNIAALIAQLSPTP